MGLADGTRFRPQNIRRWKDSAGGRLMPGYEPYKAPTLQEIEQLRQQIQSGEVKVLAEVATQYGGINPSDTIMEPLYRLAEEHIIPIGIHMGYWSTGRCLCK